MFQIFSNPPPFRDLAVNHRLARRPSDPGVRLGATTSSDELPDGGGAVYGLRGETLGLGCFGYVWLGFGMFWSWVLMFWIVLVCFGFGVGLMSQMSLKSTQVVRECSRNKGQVG